MAGAVVEDGGRIARDIFERGWAGVKSGLNKQSMGRIFGVSQLAPMGARGAKMARYGWQNKGALAGGKEIDKAATKWARTDMADHAKKLGKQALHWGSGGGFTGMRRVGAAGARLAGAGVALNIADFLNPFGFGSIDD